MSDKTPSRRAFLKGGALAAAPLAAAGAAAEAGAREHAARIARLEDEAAIRGLHQDWLRKVNVGADTGALFADPRRARLAPAAARVEVDHAGAPDELRLHADGLTASARYACVVETRAELAPDCTLAQMRHAQGEGWLRRSDHRRLRADYVKMDGRWAIAGLRFELA
jgi:hypothetical protein